MHPLIDSHCHLTYEGLGHRTAEVLRRAADAGVAACVTIATDPEDAERALELSRRHSSVFVAAGLHPHNAGKGDARAFQRLAEIAARPDVRAVGETGLDYRYSFADRAAQMTAFRRQLEIACRLGKPVVIHCREAVDDALGVLADYSAVPRVVFHCFTGTLDEAARILDRGDWISLTGVVTFKSSESLRRVAREIPADRLMIETDSPYLSPEPVRNVRPNEPAHLVHTATCIARERGLDLDALARLTTANARRFFNLPEHTTDP